jgi:hypothetical protein
MTPALALRLRDSLGAAEAVARAPSSRLRDLGVPAALVSRMVAGPRTIPQIAAGLNGLTRLGITPLPIVSPHYPERLMALPDPPLVLYVQGAWPIARPLVLRESSGALESPVAEAWTALRSAVSPHVAWAALHESHDSADESPRVLGVPWGLMLARRKLAHESWQGVGSGATTLVSAVAPTTQGDATTAAAITDVVAALADVIMMLPGASNERLITTARLLGRPVFTIAPPRESLPPGVSRLWGASGSRRLLRSLGIHQSAGATAQQERLF